MNLEPIIQNEINKKDKYILTHTHIYIYGIQKDGTDDPIQGAAKETQM